MYYIYIREVPGDRSNDKNIEVFDTWNTFIYWD